MGGSRPPRPYAGGRPSHTADLSAPSVIIPFFSVRFQEGNSVCVLLCGVGIILPCTAFVVSRSKKLLGDGENPDGEAPSPRAERQEQQQRGVHPRSWALAALKNRNGGNLKCLSFCCFLPSSLGRPSGATNCGAFSESSRVFLLGF